MDTPPIVSVCTPVYNGAKFLDKCIRGVLNQTFTNFEYIIVDNASTDATAEIIERYRKQDPRIRVFRNQETIPVVANFNKCIEHLCSGTRWIKYALADDYLFPHCIEEMVNLGASDESIGIVSAYRIYDTRLMYLGLPMDQSVFAGGDILKKQLMRQLYVCTGSPNSTMYRREAFERIGKFNDAYLHPDTDLALKLLDSNKLGFIHQVLTWTGHHAGRVEVQSKKAGRNIKDYLDFGFKQLGEYHSVSFSRAEREKLTDFYAKEALEYRLSRLAHFDAESVRAMAAWIPKEVSSRYSVVFRKHFVRMLKLFFRQFISGLKSRRS